MHHQRQAHACMFDWAHRVPHVTSVQKYDVHTSEQRFCDAHDSTQTKTMPTARLPANSESRSSLRRLRHRPGLNFERSAPLVCGAARVAFELPRAPQLAVAGAAGPGAAHLVAMDQERAAQALTHNGDLWNEFKVKIQHEAQSGHDHAGRGALTPTQQAKPTAKQPAWMADTVVDRCRAARKLYRHEYCSRPICW